MRASGTANHPQHHIELSSQARLWYGSSTPKGFGSLLSEFGTSSAHKSSTTLAGTPATAAAPPVQGSSATAQLATNSATSESGATEAYQYVAPVAYGINLGPQGSSLSPEEADANQAARLAAANQAVAAKAAARNLTISDYLAPGDSLSNYPDGITIAQLIQGYSCTAANAADPKFSEYATTGRVMVNGAAITGLAPDPYGGPPAPLGSKAAAIFVTG